jgi:phage terminase Nu1 subunit (DNA packaging protein)
VAVEVRMNRTEIAEAMGVTMVTIDNWRKEGMPVLERGGPGKQWVFNLPDVVKWFGDRKAKQAAGDAPGDMVEIEKRTAQAKMLKAELELAQARGEVAPIGDFERAWSKAFAQIQANVMNVAQRVVIQLLGETNETTFKETLKAELALALQQSAEADIDLDDLDDAE